MYFSTSGSQEEPELLQLRLFDDRVGRPKFLEEPGYCEELKLWLYGNVRLLKAPRAHVDLALGKPDCEASELDAIEVEAGRLVLSGKVLVSGIHNAKHQRAAVVPLRWGAPRILIFPGGFRHHLGEKLMDEPFRAARLWRYQWDAKTDLAVSRRAPDKLPTFARFNPSVDRLIQKLSRNCPGGSKRMWN